MAHAMLFDVSEILKDLVGLQWNSKKMFGFQNVREEESPEIAQACIWK